MAKENTTQAAPLKERRGFFADCLIEGGMNAGATPTKWARFWPTISLRWADASTQTKEEQLRAIQTGEEKHSPTEWSNAMFEYTETLP